MGLAQTDQLFTDNGTTITDKLYGMTWEKDAGTMVQPLRPIYPAFLKPLDSLITAMALRLIT